MNEAVRRQREIDARTWMICDERIAAKVALAFRRFREETKDDAAAAMLVSAWAHMAGHTDGFDRRPFRAK